MKIPSNTAAFLAKNKTVIIIAVLFIIVAVIFYRKGKKTTTIAELPNDNPGGSLNQQSGNGGVNLSGNQLSSNEISLLADQLHSDINDIFALRNNSLYERLVTLSDTDLVKVYNAYNAKYQAKDGETLLQALNGELTAWFGSGKYNMQTVITRLSKYNLK